MGRYTAKEITYSGIAITLIAAFYIVALGYAIRHVWVNVK